jgi:thiosulfate/3-mercaptopyruvate sulfurtransferase
MASRIFMTVLILARSAQAEGLPVVSTEWLAQNLADRSVVVLHVGAQADYDAGHIPGARLLKPTDISVNGENELRMELPPVAQLQEAFGKVGVSNSTRVVLCSGTEAVQATTRVYFTLDYLGHGDHVSVLDGGLPLWRAEGRPITREAPAITPGELTVRPKAELVVDSGWVREHLRDTGVVLLDARTREFYSGANAGIAARAGHIPGARNIPFDTTLDEQRKFRSLETLQELLRQSGVAAGKTVVSYCHVGMQATVLYFVARSLGYDVRLYDGSFQDWSRRPELPVEASQ